MSLAESLQICGQHARVVDSRQHLLQRVREFGNGAVRYEVLALNVVLGRRRADVVPLQNLQSKSAQVHCDILWRAQSPFAKVSLGLKKKKTLRVELFEHRDVAPKVPMRVAVLRALARNDDGSDLRACSDWLEETRRDVWLAVEPVHFQLEGDGRGDCGEMGRGKSEVRKKKMTKKSEGAREAVLHTSRRKKVR